MITLEPRYRGPLLDVRFELLDPTDDEVWALTYWERLMTSYRMLKDWPGYRVGSNGSVQSRWKRRGKSGWFICGGWRNLAGGRDQDGYRNLILCRDGVRRTARICRLVLEQFVGPCPPGMEAAHCNGINNDDRLSNLRWATHVSNMADAIEHGRTRRGETNGNSILLPRDVKAIRGGRKAGIPVRSLADRHGVSIQTVYAILSGKIWKHLT